MSSARRRWRLGSPRPMANTRYSVLSNTRRQTLLSLLPSLNSRPLLSPPFNVSWTPYNCHCFPQIVFKACKELFPGSQECRYRDLADGHCSISNDLHLICQIYERNWEEVVQRHTGMGLEAQCRAYPEEHRALGETLKRLGEECRKLEELNKALESWREQRTVP
ncbi:hypothetical protein EDC04DRAFT_544590 [Pisolithus marmoratus]|nr:hypothetical protein EDC04DRAFT_544590 [Pisolithus marmoratus]